MAICSRRLTRNHKKHEVVDIEQEKSVELQRTIEKVKKNLKARIGKVVTAKQVIEQKIEIAVVKLMNQKQEIIEKFDDMIQQIKDESRDVYTTFDEDVSTMRENLVLLQSLEENVNRDDAETYEEIINKLETVAGIEETVCGFTSLDVELTHGTSTQRAKHRRKQCMEM